MYKQFHSFCVGFLHFVFVFMSLKIVTEYLNFIESKKGNPKRNYPPLPWMVQNEAVAHIPDAANQGRITDAITDAAVDFIVTHKDEPFFAYVPHSAVHAPHTVTPERLEAAGGDVMRALITANDRAMGGNIVDLRGVAMERLEARLQRLEETHRSVIAAAYENLAGMAQVHRAILAFLEPITFEGFLASYLLSCRFYFNTELLS